MLPAERNYPVHEQEELAIVKALKEWRHYLHGQPFKVYTDHRSLTHLFTQPSLSKRQLRWMEFLSEFDFTIEYIKGEQNVVADALSRRADHAVESSDAAVQGAECRAQVTAVSSATSPLLEEIKHAYTADPLCARVLAGDVGGYTVTDGVIYKDSSIYVPNDKVLKTRLLAECHDAAASGHLGVSKTTELLARRFYWPGMHGDAEQYVTTCLECQRNKPSNARPYGLLQPLPIPQRTFEQVTIDLITQLPRSMRGNDAIVVMVDKLSKLVHYAPCKTAISAPQLASLCPARVGAAAWRASVHRERPRPALHLSLLARALGQARHQARHEHSLPSAERRPDGARQPHARRHAALHRRIRAGRLG